MNEKAVNRTFPATPGLFKISISPVKFRIFLLENIHPDQTPGKNFYCMFEVTYILKQPRNEVQSCCPVEGVE